MFCELDFVFLERFYLLFRVFVLLFLSSVVWRNTVLIQRWTADCAALNLTGLQNELSKPMPDVHSICSLIHERAKPPKWMAPCSGVASYWGTCPLKFWKCCAFCSCCQLNCKNVENYLRKTWITFSSILLETRSNLHKQIKTVWELKKISGMGEDKKFMLCPSPHFLAMPLAPYWGAKLH